MSCLLLDVSGHFVKSVSTAKKQVLPRPNAVGGEQRGLAATPYDNTQGDASIPVTKKHINEVLSIPETQNDRLSFPNLRGTAEEEDKEDEEDEEEEGNGEEGSQDGGEDDNKEEEDEKGEDCER